MHSVIYNEYCTQTYASQCRYASIQTSMIYPTANKNIFHYKKPWQVPAKTLYILKILYYFPIACYVCKYFIPSPLPFADCLVNKIKCSPIRLQSRDHTRTNYFQVLTTTYATVSLKKFMMICHTLHGSNT